MAITKDHIFVVVGRQQDEAGEPRGEVINLIVCSADSKSVRLFMAENEPKFSILSVLSLVTLEDTVKQVRAVIAGKDQSYRVVIDPILMMD